MSQELTKVEPSRDVASRDFMPLLSIDEAVARKDAMTAYINRIMKSGVDYGIMPGDRRDDARKVLFKPGAEKLCSVFGLSPKYVKETIIEDWTGKDHGEPLFYYEYRCQLWRGDRFMGEGIGSANSWEAKYRWRWVSEEAADAYVDPADDMDTEEFNRAISRLQRRGSKKKIFEPDFALVRRETTGQYGKPADYWERFDTEKAEGRAVRVKDHMMGKGDKAKPYDGWEITIDATQYRIPNPDFGDLVNTLQKMGQKRSLIAAALVVTNCSDAFTQDIIDDDDLNGHGPNADGAGDDVGHHEPPLTKDGRKPDPAEATKEAAKEPTEGIQVPPDIAKLLEQWKAEGKKPLIQGLNWAKAKLVAILPDNGEEEYKRTLEKAGVKPKGNDNAVLLRAILMVSTLADQLRLASMKTQRPAAEQTISVNVNRVFDSWSDAPDAAEVPIGTRIMVGGKSYEAAVDNGNPTYRSLEQ